jgi:hypothetical protein
VTRAGEVRGEGGGVGEGAEGEGAVVRGDARGGVVLVVDRDGERRALRVLCWGGGCGRGCGVVGVVDG